MLITKKYFGQLLNDELNKTNDVCIIADWIYKLTFNNKEDIDPHLDDILYKLSFMSMGEEFEYTLEELHALANDLINEKK
jgi:hypothetical protein